MGHCRSVLVEPFVKKAIKRIVSIEVAESGKEAAAIYTVRIIFDEQSYVYKFKPLMMAKVKTDLCKTAGGSWFISRVEVLTIDLRPAKWKDMAQAGRDFR